MRSYLQNVWYGNTNGYMVFVVIIFNGWNVWNLKGLKFCYLILDSYSLLRVIQTFRFISTIQNIIIIDRVVACPLYST